MALRTLLIAVFLFCVTAPALAESDSVAPRIDFSLGAHLAFTPADVCQRDSDVVGCSGQGTAGLQAAVIWRPFEQLGFGPTLAIAGKPGDDTGSAGSADQHDVQMWRLALEGRYFLSERTRSGLYLALEGGAVFINETRTLGRREDSVTQSGGLLGAGLGYTLALPFGLGVGVSLRGFYTFMPEEAPDLGSTDYEAHAWGGLPWIALAIDGSFGIGL
jgi:hypothetical protein